MKKEIPVVDQKYCIGINYMKIVMIRMLDNRRINFTSGWGGVTHKGRRDTNAAVIATVGKIV